TYASRLPFPFVSRMNAVHPWAFCSSWVLSNTFVSNQPSTVPPPVNQSTPLLSKFRWCVPKQVSIVVTCFVFGSYISICRLLVVMGNATADGCVEPWRQKACVSVGRTRDAIQTRLWPSIAKLCDVVCAVQIASSPQYGDGCGGGLSFELGVFGSRTCSFT